MPDVNAGALSAAITDRLRDLALGLVAEKVLRRCSSAGALASICRMFSLTAGPSSRGVRRGEKPFIVLIYLPPSPPYLLPLPGLRATLAQNACTRKTLVLGGSKVALGLLSSLGLPDRVEAVGLRQAAVIMVGEALRAENFVKSHLYRPGNRSADRS
ncbi:hypothetical protein [uncultured Friedmanniella sp.]|uniref:hypothetical protein n=1 Tax=uncultured Friedmanniella sp. TaxID=335381 RepID=UPI0035CAA588